MDPRIAIVIPTLSGGGAERAALEMASVFPDRHRVIVEAAVGDLRGDPLAEAALPLAARVEGSRARRVRRLARALRSGDFDLCLSTLSPFVVAAAGRLAGLPAAHWLQNPMFTLPGVASGGSRARVGRKLVTAYSRRAAFLAAPAPGLMAEWERCGADARKVGLLPNPVRVQAIPSASPTADGRHRIVTIGRLAPQKRHDLLISAVAELADLPLLLTIVGSGPLEGDLRRLAHALGLGERVRLAGFHREPWDFLAEADVFVLASDFEGFGNVLVEALAAGLPVVATDAPYGPRFILDHGRFGRLVPPGDVGALAAGIRDALRRPISEPDARRRWAERFAPANVARWLDVLARRALAGQRLDAGPSQWP